MLNSGKKIRALRDIKKNILTLVLSEKKILNETKNHNHTPLQVKWSVPKDRPCIQRMIVKVRHNTCFKDVLLIDLSIEVASYCNEVKLTVI